MSDYDQIREKILENATSPKKVKSDGTEAEQFDMSDQIAMIQELERQEAKKNKKNRPIFLKLKSNGAS